MKRRDDDDVLDAPADDANADLNDVGFWLEKKEREDMDDK